MGEESELLLGVPAQNAQMGRGSAGVGAKQFQQKLEVPDGGQQSGPVGQPRGMWLMYRKVIHHFNKELER